MQPEMQRRPIDDASVGCPERIAQSGYSAGIAGRRTTFSGRTTISAAAWRIISWRFSNDSDTLVGLGNRHRFPAYCHTFGGT
jgi:ribosome modulation factor